MNANIDPFTFTVPITLSARLHAEKFRTHQSDPDRIGKVYLNTLAVYATHYYLQCLGWETNLEAGDSWNPAMQTLMDVADLVLKDGSRIECRPVLTGAEYVRVPSEVWSDRIGYVAVQIDESLRKATLLGFVDRVGEAKLPLQQLRSLEELPSYLNRLREPKAIAKLSQWLENIYEAGWQAANEFLTSPQPALNFRNRDCASFEKTENSFPVIGRSKILDLKPIGDRVILALGVILTTDKEMDIWVKLSPHRDRTHLPPNLQLMVLDEMGEVVMHAQSRSTESILLKFSGEIGERFSIQVALDEIGLLNEAFVI
jgi:hypothetical protein